MTLPRKGPCGFLETVKVKVKLSLCLTKHHAMKMYWGSVGLAPHISVIRNSLFLFLTSRKWKWTAVLLLRYVVKLESKT